VSEAKPYDIPKQLVWEAYQRVKANRGAAGVDGVSLAAFEQNLKGNLYKIWIGCRRVHIIHHPCGSSRYRRIRAARAHSAYRPSPIA
jgi:retron-type reverse transcriptase